MVAASAIALRGEQGGATVLAVDLTGSAVGTFPAAVGGTVTHLAEARADPRATTDPVPGLVEAAAHPAWAPEAEAPAVAAGAAGRAAISNSHNSEAKT